MPKRASTPGFSPTRHLIDVLITTAKTSVPAGQWLNCGSCQMCDKQKSPVNVCVETSDHLLMLSVCNVSEGIARNAILSPLPGQDITKLKHAILRFIKRIGMKTKLDNKLSGKCADSLVAAEKIAKYKLKMIKQTKQEGRREMAKKKRVENQGALDHEDNEVYSKRFPEPVTLPKSAQEVYLALRLRFQSHGRASFDLPGIYCLAEPIALLDQMSASLGKKPLWWQDGWKKLLAITPKIVERSPDGEGMLIHNIRLESSMTLALPKKPGRQSQTHHMEDLPGTEALRQRKPVRRHKLEGAPSGLTESSLNRSQTPQSEDGKMAEAIQLTDRQYMLYYALLKLAGDNPAKKMEISHYAKRVMKLANFDIPQGSLSSYVKQLAKLGLVEKGSERGSIKVHRKDVTGGKAVSKTPPGKRRGRATQEPSDPPAPEATLAQPDDDNSLMAILKGGNGSTGSADALAEQFSRQFQGVASVLELAMCLQKAGFQFQDNGDGSSTISLTTSK